MARKAGRRWWTVIARTEELELEGAEPWRCRVCGDPVPLEDFREHLVQHNPNARGMDWEDVSAQYEGGTT